MPLAEVLNLISKPPGSAPPFIPYKPVPYLVPLPAKHTLLVKRPKALRDEAAFGDLREDNLQLVIKVRTVLCTACVVCVVHRNVYCMVVLYGYVPRYDLTCGMTCGMTSLVSKDGSVNPGSFQR